ncbi:MAG TPA: archaetidylserine decarboxylase [Spirochaetota bacterium]|nr:archaetidylserine decarboxylase [Spirochaetota bacterium]
MKAFAIFLFRIIPTGLLSRCFGYAARLALPSVILVRIIVWYSAKFGVRTDEMVCPDGGFRCLEDFFTRRLKPGVHVVDRGKKSIVSPVDARIDHFGAIEGATVFQAKGVGYRLGDLIPSDYHKNFINGSFITLYLSPGDYHRIHSPVGGEVAGYFALPGKLLTVQEYMVRGLPGLFAKNERLISYIQSDAGIVAVVKVGAMNVGRITVTYDGVETNRAFSRRVERFYPSGKRPLIDKGGELGAFHLGSTIVLLFQKDSIKMDAFAAGDRVRVGERIAVFR